jgi:hypothetical protein
MKRFRQFATFLGLFSAIILTGCISQQTAAHSAKGQLLQEAERYTSDLKGQDKLPGYSSNERGRVIASAPWKGGNVSYPASVFVRAWKEGDETIFCYDLVKDTPESNWQLTRATHLDKDKKLIAQLFPQ